MRRSILFALLLFCIPAKGQDIVDFFKSVPLPYGWRMSDNTKEELIKYGKITEHYYKLLYQQNDQSNINQYTTAIIDKQNGYLTINTEGYTLSICYWTKKNGEEEKEYLVAVESKECSSPGCHTESLDFYIYKGNQYYTYDGISISKIDFFKDLATKGQIEKVAASIVYELPRQGKDILVRFELQDGEGTYELNKGIKELLKGDVIKLKYIESLLFEIEAPYFDSSNYYF